MQFERQVVDEISIINEKTWKKQYNYELSERKYAKLKSKQARLEDISLFPHDDPPDGYPNPQQSESRLLKEMIR